MENLFHPPFPCHLDTKMDKWGEKSRDDRCEESISSTEWLRHQRGLHPKNIKTLWWIHYIESSLFLSNACIAYRKLFLWKFKDFSLICFRFSYHYTLWLPYHSNTTVLFVFAVFCQDGPPRHIDCWASRWENGIPKGQSND